MKVNIGILTANGRQGGFGGNQANFRRLVRAASKVSQACPVYAIEPDGQVTVYTFHEASASFHRCEAPLPAVLYNRIPTRLLERSVGVVRRVNDVIREGVVVTNPRFLQKDEVLQLWQKSTQLRSCVPEAAVLHEPEQIERFLQAYTCVYVKPIDGMAGVGIVQLRRDKDAVYVRLQRAGNAQPAVRMTTGQSIRSLMKRARHTRYVLQAGADLAEYEGRRFDFRLLAHMQADQRMRITGMGVRLGPPGGITTHVPNGGEVLAPAPVLRQVFGTRAEMVGARVVHVGELAANRICELPGVWTECSLDIGVTPAGEACLFEANAKPMKFDEPTIEREAKRQLVARLLALAKG